MHLPSFIPRVFGQNDDNAVEPPMPYDSDELESQRPASRTAAGPSSSPRRQSNAQANGDSQPVNRRAPSNNRSAPSTNRSGQSANRDAQRTEAPVARSKPQPQTLRSSPKTDGRRSELAEALSGLRDSDGAANPIAKKPAARSDADATPSYLRRGAKPPVTKTKKSPPSSPRTAPPSAHTSSARRLDIRDALLGNEDAEDDIASMAADAAAEPAEAAKSEQTPQAPLAGVDATSSKGQQLGGVPAEPAPSAVEEPPTPVEKPTTSSPAPAATNRDWPQSADLRSGPDVLLSCRQPVIVSKVEGPQRIVVGQTAEYKVTLENRGDDDARDLKATLAVPTSAEVVDAAATSGVVERTAGTAENGAASINWQLNELPSRASQTLTLQLVPRSGQPLQLGVEWAQAAVVSQTTVEVQEPKLRMDISGPAEVLFGKAQRFSLTLANPGTGAAEDVSIDLTPPGGDKNSVVHHRIGASAPGESKKIELELTAREAGDLKIQAAATAAGDLHADAVKSVLCRKAELQIDWRGPDKNFAGAVATYFFRVRNPGTAPADQVSVTIDLPKGAELVDASDGHAWDAAKSSVVWQTGSLDASQERFVQLRCKLSQPGVNQMAMTARTAAGDLSDSKSAPVTIEALADLKLEVSDPKGVVPVGEMAIYEIHVRNRGLTAAHGVNVVGMFSEGIDPSQVEGGQYVIRDGRVSFRTIDSLSAGGEAVFKIHAKATQPGTHIFRAEVVCDDLETKLSAEETTRFFVEEQRWADASAAYGSAGAPTTK